MFNRHSTDYPNTRFKKSKFEPDKPGNLIEKNSKKKRLRVSPAV